MFQFRHKDKKKILIPKFILIFGIVIPKFYMIFGIRDPKGSRSSTPFTFALLIGQRFSIPLRAGDRYTGVQEPA
ncbi:hypothetical protein PREVCOP_05567 [Segatella copri DSM 18205]|uniref:Uncharacterized protein n=1 Tax=Segatella copri DSM 18205 TaxID=537011 RepID=D1PEB9_9BACT|nr:hypothetical protein PREVCOP_05567 [Segatella copri DSM 18205]